MFCFSSLATHLPGMAVMPGAGDAGTGALTGSLSATAEGKPLTTRIRCGAAKTQTAQ